MIFRFVKRSRTTGQTNGPGSAYSVVAPEEELEDTKGVIRIRISKNRQHNGQKYKSTKVLTTIYKACTKDRVTCTPLKTGVNALNN